MSGFGDVPSTQHWALLTEDKQSIHHEGDERSRTHPGHGYPAYTETITSIRYEAFKSEAELLERVKYLPAGRAYKAIHVQPLHIEVELKAVVRP